MKIYFQSFQSEVVGKYISFRIKHFFLPLPTTSPIPILPLFRFVRFLGIYFPYSRWIGFCGINVKALLILGDLRIMVNIPQKQQTLPADVLTSESEDLFLTSSHLLSQCFDPQVFFIFDFFFLLFIGFCNIITKMLLILR